MKKVEFEIYCDDIVIINVHIPDAGIHNATVRYLSRRIDPERLHTPTRYYEVAKFYFEKATENIDDAPDIVKPIIEAIKNDGLFHIAGIIAFENI